MPDQPWPITAKSVEELIQQTSLLFDELFEERVGGAELGDVFGVGDDDILALTLATDPGLEKVGNALRVKVQADGGITRDEKGLSNTGAFFATDTQMLFYQDTAPTGWTIQTNNDKLVFVSKGNAAGGETGGGPHSTGTWSHDHAFSGITVTTGPHLVSTHTAVANSGLTAGGKVAPQTFSGTTNVQSAWRPDAEVCIICKKD